MTPDVGSRHGGGGPALRRDGGRRHPGRLVRSRDAHRVDALVDLARPTAPHRPGPTPRSTSSSTTTPSRGATPWPASSARSRHRPHPRHAGPPTQRRCQAALTGDGQSPILRYVLSIRTRSIGCSTPSATAADGRWSSAWPAAGLGHRARRPSTCRFRRSCNTSACSRPPDHHSRPNSPGPHLQLAADALTPAAEWISRQRLPAERGLDRLGTFSPVQRTRRQRHEQHHRTKPDPTPPSSSNAITRCP